ncbi:MAG: hypothetical protein KC503_15085 [Myxococcales bacterium]|nr:hypothetical protein [Myxococcales bacterium]
MESTLTRLIYREFLLEPDLYREAGLEQLPAKIAQAIEVSPSEALSRLTASPLLEPLDLETLQHLVAVRDMAIISRTAAALSHDLKEPAVTYDQCCRQALIYAVAGMNAHVYAALRAAASKEDSYARHHYLYSLLLGLEGDYDRALWELEMALEREPYAEARVRLRFAAEVIEKAQKAAG